MNADSVYDLLSGHVSDVERLDPELYRLVYPLMLSRVASRSWENYRYPGAVSLSGLDRDTILDSRIHPGPISLAGVRRRRRGRPLA